MKTTAPPPLPQATTNTKVIVPLALAGTFVAGVGAQLLGPQLVALRDGLGATAAGASWIATLYTIATFVAFSLSPLLVRMFGLRRLFVASATVFVLMAGIAAVSSELPVFLVARAVQGFAGGMFGPLTFVAIFRTWGGPRLLLGFALLAFVLLVSANLGPLLATPIVQVGGWRALFVSQVALALPLIVAGLRWMPMSLIQRDGARNEWLQVSLLGAASAAWVLFASQGAGLGAAFAIAILIVAIALSMAFVVAHLRSPSRVLSADKIVDRRFGLPVALNFTVRAASAATAFLLPLSMTSQHASPRAAWWLFVAQIAAFPIAWALVRRVDARLPMASGLVFLSAGILLTGHAVSMPVGLALVGIGQMLFLVPALMTGASALKPEHGATGTIVFNMSAVGGPTFGIAVIAQFVDASSRLADLQDAFLIVSAIVLLAAPLTRFIGPSAPRR